MHLYISDLSLIVLAVFYLPLVLWTLYRIARSRLGVKTKAMALVATSMAAYALVLGDVTVNSLAMAKACPRAGLHVYQKVEVEGYFDRMASEETLINHPYRFVEFTRPGEKVTHLERQSDGKITRTTLEEPTAKYEVVYDNKAPVPELGVRSMQRWWVRDRATGKAVGEWLAFSPMHGWLDRYTLNALFGAALRGCSGPEKGLAGYWDMKLLPPKKSFE